MKVTYDTIAELTNKTTGGIKQMKSNNPEQLELLKLGAMCKINNIQIKDLECIVKIKDDSKTDS